jgi:hypothetical protein
VKTHRRRRSSVADHFPAKWTPVRRRKCDQARNQELSPVYLNRGKLQQAAEKLSFVIPEAAKRLSGIHSPDRKDAELQGLWIPGSDLRSAPE